MPQVLVVSCVLALMGCGDRPIPAPVSAPRPKMPLPHEVRGSIKITTNDVILIETQSGNALVQFLSFSERLRSRIDPESSATYRIRYPSDAPLSEAATNTLRESYTSRPDPALSNMYVLTRKPDHNASIKIDRATLEWSYANSNAGWLGYYSNEVTIKLLTSEAFDNPPR